MFVCFVFTSGGVVPELAASASTGNLLEIQNLGLRPKPTCSQDSRVFLCKEHPLRSAALTSYTCGHVKSVPQAFIVQLN